MFTTDTSRYEIKFVARNTEIHRMANWLQSHAEGFSKAYPDRRVNNVYFDSPDLHSYLANLAGISDRAKIRYRWYGESRTPTPGNFEFKYRKNALGWKETHPIGDAPYEPDNRWTDIRSRILAQIPATARIWPSIYSTAVLVNRYDRRYYISADRNVRVTIDRDIGVWDQRRSTHLNLNKSTPLPEAIIVEVKCAFSDRAGAERVIQTIPLRPSRHSKYVVGVNAITHV
jgi:hypothetical protein